MLPSIMGWGMSLMVGLGRRRGVVPEGPLVLMGHLAGLALCAIGMVQSYAAIRWARPFRWRGQVVKGIGFAWVGFVLGAGAILLTVVVSLLVTGLIYIYFHG